MPKATKDQKRRWNHALGDFTPEEEQLLKDYEKRYGEEFTRFASTKSGQPANMAPEAESMFDSISESVSGVTEIVTESLPDIGDLSPRELIDLGGLSPGELIGLFGQVKEKLQPVFETVTESLPDISDLSSSIPTKKSKSTKVERILPNSVYEGFRSWGLSDDNANSVYIFLRKFLSEDQMLQLGTMFQGDPDQLTGSIQSDESFKPTPRIFGSSVFNPNVTEVSKTNRKEN